MTGSSSESRLKRAVRWLGESLSGSAMRPADFITRAANSLEQKLNAISRKKRSGIKKSSKHLMACHYGAHAGVPAPCSWLPFQSLSNCSPVDHVAHPA